MIGDQEQNSNQVPLLPYNSFNPGPFLADVTEKEALVWISLWQQAELDFCRHYINRLWSQLINLLFTLKGIQLFYKFSMEAVEDFPTLRARMFKYQCTSRTWQRAYEADLNTNQYLSVELCHIKALFAATESRSKVVTAENQPPNLITEHLVLPTWCPPSSCA